eukprot:TRINITY_DN26822_c0_g1_i1.p1 TRINITY_DN26822_c0_g1~~TRINITY_DN26822_c0_g1_i1.p1  ORF type:complete len:249 (-),score=34.83 TRINITY_DN26822_c0_g1_i1:320-1066(-)
MPGSENKCKFEEVLRMHGSCDVILTCPSSSLSKPDRSVSFYCHREVLARCCEAIASMQSFETLASATRVAQLFLPVSADIVYEILRYAYRGVLLLPPKFRERLAEFLVAADELGMFSNEPSVDDVVRERIWESPPRSTSSILDASLLRDIIASLSNKEVREAMRPLTVGCLHVTVSNGLFVGFKTRQVFLAKVAEHRLRASGGPPPSDPDVIFNMILDRLKSPSLKALEAQGWTIEDPSRRMRRSRSI